MKCLLNAHESMTWILSQSAGRFDSVLMSPSPTLCSCYGCARFFLDLSSLLLEIVAKIFFIFWGVGTV